MQKIDYSCLNLKRNNLCSHQVSYCTSSTAITLYTMKNQIGINLNCFNVSAAGLFVIVYGNQAGLYQQLLFDHCYGGFSTHQPTRAAEAEFRVRKQIVLGLGERKHRGIFFHGLSEEPHKWD